MEKSILPVEEVPQAREHDGDTSDTSNKARGTRRFTRVDYHPTPDCLSLHFRTKLRLNRVFVYESRDLSPSFLIMNVIDNLLDE